ncbi:SDR family oxidoreductase [Wenxinia marina]|uniref:Putative nucleoside-diphosphate-sugar epimerase n=1 Tax=Wenxinia marina DSM 24838 TaxID=1123501 RepID=A0A0D0PHV3_9RHOB|nr:SDR family oxidoreductase [Wenxinia marina]KIQ70966.1 putative nucleoside-diphosphate-sugar epimerase [Wenxinia marina DSM 24838]GGL55906.1 hypothetical protein GCM10011392_07930 [Wenxinia marina]
MADGRRRALVLGGYGLIGAACLRRMTTAGWRVTGVGRDAAAARRVAPDADWAIRDLAAMGEAEWRALVAGADVVINASGALQDGGGDDLGAIHERAVVRLVRALEGSRTRLVQISAAGVAPDAPTAFFRTKARGDGAIRASGLDWVILRPTLVIGAGAFGGSALLRAAAALPGVAPQVLPEAMIQTVALDDVADAVLAAAEGAIPGGTVADLTEAEARSLPETVAAVRHWLGLPRALWAPPVPPVLLRGAAAVADGLGRLGWRSPLRSTAIRALADGVRGDPSAWEAAGGAPCRPLEQTLAAMPAGLQERWFARLYLLFPLAVATLSVFWIASGLIGLARTGAAAEVLTSRGWSDAAARVAVWIGGVADLALGLAILWRPLVRAAALGMAALAGGYLVAATLAAPDLWADPMGPLVKVIPGLVLALVVAALTESR